jgi:membrane protease YdiL (CAAX protease family)
LLSTEHYNLCHSAGLNFFFVCYLGFPLLAMLLLRIRPSEVGLGPGDIRAGIRMILLCGIVYAPCFVLLVGNASFREYYSWVWKNHHTWASLIVADCIATGLLAFRTEFLYRGFMLLGLKSSLGTFSALLIQLVPYVYSHSGKPLMETLGSFPVGLALAWLAIRTGSCWYGIILHGGIAILLDIAVFALRP